VERKRQVRVRHHPIAADNLERQDVVKITSESPAAQQLTIRFTSLALIPARMGSSTYRIACSPFIPWQDVEKRLQFQAGIDFALNTLHKSRLLS
jgi:hypothetical protein